MTRFLITFEDEKIRSEGIVEALGSMGAIEGYELARLNHSGRPYPGLMDFADATVMQEIQKHGSIKPTDLDKRLYEGCGLAAYNRLFYSGHTRRNADGTVSLSTTGTVTFTEFKHKHMPQNNDKQDEEAVKEIEGKVRIIIAERGPQIKAQICDELQFASRRIVRKALYNLEKSGLLIRIGEDVFADPGWKTSPGDLAKLQKKRSSILDARKNNIRSKVVIGLGDEGEKVAAGLNANKFYNPRKWAGALQVNRRILQSGIDQLLEAGLLSIAGDPESSYLLRAESDIAAYTSSDEWEWFIPADIRSLGESMEISMLFLLLIAHRSPCTTGMLMSMSHKLGRRMKQKESSEAVYFLVCSELINGAGFDENGKKMWKTTHKGNKHVELIHELDDAEQSNWWIVKDNDLAALKRP